MLPNSFVTDWLIPCAMLRLRETSILFAYTPKTSAEKGNVSFIIFLYMYTGMYNHVEHSSFQNNQNLKCFNNSNNLN